MKPSGERILSIDIFRGLTMVVMIFVNDLASVQGLPWWTYHMPRGVNGMTYVDVVFPAFLFIVGISIPLAVERRLERGGQWALWRHILARFASLAALGIFLANWSKIDPTLTGLSKQAWSVTGLIGAMLFWNVYPRGRLYTALKWTGFALFVGMLAVFRRNGGAWLSFGYWEILGLIAKAYLAACLLYVPLRRKPWAPALLLALLCALNVVTQLGWKSLAVWPFGRGDLVSIVMAGIVASQIFVGRDGVAFPRKAREALLYAAALFAAGLAALPLGVTKLGGTPAWCLWCAAISVVIFLGLYSVVDVKGSRQWAWFAKPAGENTLLTYLVPDLYYAAGLSALGASFSTGWPGAARAAVMTAAMLAIAGVLTRMRVRMHL